MRPAPVASVVRIGSTLVAVGVAGALLPACSGSAPTVTAATVVPANAEVVRTVDGDTVVVRVQGREETVRLLGIDTPETKDRRRPVMCFGAEAAARTATLLPPGTAVRLERDVEPRDAYGRLLATVVRATDGVDVNLALAAEGYADVLTVPPNVARAEELREAVAAARRAGVGLWGACDGFGVPAAPAG